MTDAAVKELLRSKGLCGHITEGHACVLARQHDEGAHERGWTVARREVCSAHKRDAREADDVVFDCKEERPPDDHPCKVFTTPNKQHADWLAWTLTRLEL